jgi:hypothetical protein
MSKLMVVPQVRELVMEVDAEVLDQAIEAYMLEPAKRAWIQTMHDLADVTREIMMSKIPIGKGEGEGVHCRDTVIVDTLSEDSERCEYWVGPTKMVDGIPLGLILESGSIGGVIVRPSTKKAMTTPYGPKKKIIRGVTKGIRYVERTLLDLGQIAMIEDRFWANFAMQPEAAAYIGRLSSEDVEEGGEDVEA